MDRDTSVSDEELNRAFLGGDQGAFDGLMRRHEDRIFSLALRMTGDRADALDATQDAFLSAFRQAAKFRGDSSYGTWLYRIAMNACHDLLRKRSRFVHQEEPPESVAPDRVEDPVVARVDIAQALARLPEDYREAVVLHDLGGVPYEEIATITSTNIGTVKSRISRGRKRLAEELEQHPQTPASKG